MSCPACGVEPPPGARFCASCGASLVVACPACGAEATPGDRFCAQCGTSLQRSDAVEGETPAAERKVISVLFCDLAGFTARADGADPEETQQWLVPYHDQVREDVERFGGRVEKLMGDGVLAVFGAPVAHEDDAERAVRAALRLQASIADRFAVRAAVTTGEALVALADDAGPERVVGDVVNTASRLQQVAPVGGVVVDARTRDATRHAVAYQALDPVQVRGKSEPLAIYLALEAHGPGTTTGPPAAGPLVGRDHELGIVLGAFDRAVARRSAQLVTVVGEPGVGKTRLLAELYHDLDLRPDLVWWRQGRCLPYGEGVTFWALGEIVRAHAGILEAEPPTEMAAKLEAAVRALVDDPGEAEWLRVRLAPLVGLAGPGTERAERAELFRAWQRFFETLASRDPLVLVIEDLHWADEAMYDFCEHLLDEARDLPILMVCTARPELYDRRPDWGGGGRDAVTVGLSALGPDATRQLAAAVAGRDLPEQALTTLVERSGGNPLHLIEYVRLASERDLWGRLGDAGLPLPDNLQALIAARIDLLSPDDKALLQAAAVMGKVFWTGALAYLRGVDSDRVREGLRRMTQRELVRRVKRTSTLGQEEHAFAHVLVQEVAYAQIPHRERAALHAAVGGWLEAKAGDRIPDVVEHLAHHYATAVELTAEPDPELVARAHRFLMLAGDRILDLDPARAHELYRRAGELAATPAERGRALVGQASTRFDDNPEAVRLLDAGIDELAAAGERAAVVGALAGKSHLVWYQGDHDAAEAVAAELLEAVEDLPPGPEVAAGLVAVAAQRQLRGREEEALEVVERAIEVAQAAGATESFARALAIRGSALIQLGQLGAVEDVREALSIFLDRGYTARAMQAYNNLATYLIDTGHLDQGVAIIDEAIAYGSARGYHSHVDWSRNTKCEALFPLGRWDELEEILVDLMRGDAARGGSQISAFAGHWQAALLHQRGRLSDARRVWEEAIAAARAIGDPQALGPPLANGIAIAWDCGEASLAASLAEELGEMADRHRFYGALCLPWAAAAMADLGMVDDLDTLARRVVTGDSEFLAAQIARAEGLVAEARGDVSFALAGVGRLRKVADATQNRFWATVARVEETRMLRAAGRSDEADQVVAEARAAAEAMGASRLRSLLDSVRR